MLRIKRLLKPGNILMSNWAIIELDDYHGNTNRHFIGYSVLAKHYRLSTPILYYDEETNTGKTLSGSHYTFLDKPKDVMPGVLNLKKK